MAHEALNDFNKKRKPYTITKPRENWSKEEHSRFLEALKLYERDWKQIGAYVKSKTVIQIRSHAQKYFLKMEKMGRTDCIPPPRAKKRSKRPYPRSRPGRVAGGYDEETEYFIWEPGMDAEGREPAKPPAWDLKWQLMHRANLADLGPAVLDAVRHHLQQALATHVPTKTPAQPLEQQFHNNAESFSKHENGQIRADDVAPEHEKAYAFLCNLLDPNASGHAEELEKMSERDRNVVQSLLHALEGLPENPNANACNEDSNPPPPAAIYQAPTQSEFNQPANQFAFAHANGEYAPAFHHQPAQHTAQPYSSFPQQRAATQLAPSFGMKREEGLFRQPQQQPWLSPQAGFPELYDNHHHHQQHPFGLPQDPSPQRLMLPPQPQGGEGHFDHNNQHHHNNSDHYPYETSDPSKTPVGYGIPFIRTPDPHEFQPSASPLHFDSAWFSPARRHGAYDPFYTTSGFASFQTPPALIPGPSEYSSLYSADYPPQSHTPVHEIQYGGEYALQSQTPQPQELYAQAQQHAEQSHHGEFGQQQQPAVPMHTNGDNNNDMQFEYPEDRPGFHQHQLQQHQNQQQQQGFGFGFSQQQNHHNGQSQQAHVPMSRSPEPQLIRPVPIRASPPPSPQVHAQNALQALLLCNEQPLDGPAS